MPKSQDFLITVEEESRPPGSRPPSEGEAKKAKVEVAYVHIQQ